MKKSVVAGEVFPREVDFFAGLDAVEAIQNRGQLGSYYLLRYSHLRPTWARRRVEVQPAPMLLVNGLLPVWSRLRGSARAQALLAGANAKVVGILLAALYQPIWTSAIDSPKSFALALIQFAGIRFWAIPPWILVVAGALVL